MSDHLWCVNVQGPDDVIACASRFEAVDLAARFNDWWLVRFGGKVADPNEPLMWAVPILWPHNDDSHAAAIASPSPEYLWLQAEKRHLAPAPTP